MSTCIKIKPDVQMQKLAHSTFAEIQESNNQWELLAVGAIHRDHKIYGAIARVEWSTQSANGAAATAHALIVDSVRR